MITTQNCFLWAGQSFKESAVLSKGPGKGEGRENPFIWIRAGEWGVGRRIWEAMGRVRIWHSSQASLYSLCSGI